MAAFGRRDWGLNGDGFRVYFGFLSRVSLFGSRTVDGRKQAVLRQPLSRLAEIERRPGVVAFFATMLGSVAFDGLSRSSWWLDRVYDIQSSISDPADGRSRDHAPQPRRSHTHGALRGRRVHGRVKSRRESPASRFPACSSSVWSRSPSSMRSRTTSRFSSCKGSSRSRSSSDPYGQGWDLLGTDGFQPKLDVLSPNATWYVAVGALVLGHVCGLVVAHDRAVAESSSPARGGADAVRDARSHDPLHHWRHVAPLDRIT